MPLSEQEQRAFEQIAAAMGSGHLAADPSEPRLRRSRRLRLAAEVCASVSLLVFVMALFTPTPRVQAITFVIFVIFLGAAAGLYLGGGRHARTVLGQPFVSWRVRRSYRRLHRAAAPAPTRLQAPADRRPLRQRLEDRWEQRYRDQFGDR